MRILVDDDCLLEDWQFDLQSLFVEHIMEAIKVHKNRLGHVTCNVREGEESSCVCTYVPSEPSPEIELVVGKTMTADGRSQQKQ